MTRDLRSISIKFWLPVLVASLAITVWAIMTWQEYSGLRTNLIDSSMRYIQQDMDRLQYELESAFRHGDENEAEQAITSRGVYSNYSALAVIDYRHRVLFSTRFAQRGQPAEQVLADFENDRFEPLLKQKRADIRLEQDRNCYTVYYPVTLPRQAGEIRSLHTGAIFLVYDYHDDLQAIWQRLWQTSLLIAAVLLCAVVVFFIFARRYIARPITHLVDATREIADGNYDVASNVTGHGELAELGSAFNQMSERLRLSSQQRDNAESALREKEKWQRQLLNTLPNGVQENDAKGLITYSNAAHHRILGLPPGELVGRYVWDFQPDQDTKQEVMEYLAYLIKEQPEPTPYITTNITGDGKLVTLEINWDYQRNAVGEITGFISVITDISKRVQAEVDLRESERNYRSLFENAEVVIYNEDMSAVYASLQQLREQGISDLSRYLQDNPQAAWDMVAQIRVIDVNQAALHLFSANKEQALLQQIDKTFGEGAIEVFIDEFCAIWDEQTSFSAEANFVSLDGRDIKAIVSFQIPENAEDFHSIPVSIIDITERKQAEDALRRAQKMDAIGQLTGGIAHDFNNILGIIIGNLELLELQNTLEEKVRTRLDTIKHSTQRAVDLTRQLLGFSSQQTTAIRPVNINKIIRDSRNLISQSLTPQVEIEYHCAEDICLSEIDSGDFEDALLNLALNARDAMQGRGKLSIETCNCELDEGYCRLNPGVTPGRYVQLSISDDGSGIEPQQLEHIFEPFFTTKEQGKGTGLGLSMVFGFVKRSSGHVKVYSEPGIGTTFRIYLPCADDQTTAEDENTMQTEDLPHGEETILVVDDEPDLLELVATTLQEQGYQVITAVDGNDALRKLDQYAPIDLLFSDVVMPGGINGYELAEIAVEKRPGLRVLLTSGYTEKAVARNGQARFNANLLSKPYTQIELVKQIHHTLTSNLKT